MPELSERERLGSAKVGSEQLASALRELAADLVAERQQVAALRRENKQLMAQLETLRHYRPPPAPVRRDQ